MESKRNLLSRESKHGLAIALLRKELDDRPKLDLTHHIEHSMKLVSGGASSDIYKCTIRLDSAHKLRGKAVAVRKIRSFLQTNLDPITIARFAKEIKIWDRVQHKNCLRLHGYIFVINELPALVTEWVENGTVLEYLAANPQADVLLMAFGIAEGLNFLHSKDIIHADLKTSNILVSDEGDPLICDFGLSLALPGAMTSIRTMTSREIGGTHRWMAPELLLGVDAKNTKASDVWAYGMTVLELITRKSPYSHLKIEGQVLLALIRHELPSRPTVFENVTHERLWFVCDRCWTIDSLQRPNMDDIVRLLQKKDISIGQWMKTKL